MAGVIGISKVHTLTGTINAGENKTLVTLEACQTAEIVISDGGYGCLIKVVTNNTPTISEHKVILGSLRSCYTLSTNGTSFILNTSESRTPSIKVYKK